MHQLGDSGLRPHDARPALVSFPTTDSLRRDADPLKHVDLAAFDDDGNPLEVWPCRFCDLWHIEVIHGTDTLIREWHAATCEHYLAIAAETDLG